MARKKPLEPGATVYSPDVAGQRTRGTVLRVETLAQRNGRGFVDIEQVYVDWQPRP